MLAATEQFDAALGLYDRLVDGDELACRDFLLGLREQDGASIQRLCGAVTTAFHKIGDAWECRELTVYREHVASQIGHRLLLGLRATIPPPRDDAPVAIGCSPEQDPYLLPSTMVELVLRERGWRSQSLGANLPLEMLEPALDELNPQLCWVSVSHVENDQRLHEQLASLARIAQDRNVEVICGGRALNEEITHRHPEITFAAELHDLNHYPPGEC